MRMKATWELESPCDEVPSASLRSAQGDTQFLSTLKLFSISVKAEMGALAEVKRAFHLPRQGDHLGRQADESCGGAEPF